MNFLHINFITAVILLIGIFYGAFIWHKEFKDLNGFWTWGCVIMPLLILINLISWIATGAKP